MTGNIVVMITYVGMMPIFLTCVIVINNIFNKHYIFRDIQNLADSEFIDLWICLLLWPVLLFAAVLYVFGLIVMQIAIFTADSISNKLLDIKDWLTSTKE